MLTNRPFTKTILCSVLVLVQTSSAFAGIVTLQGDMNARESNSFLGKSNVKAIFPKGTEGEILERRELPSGNFGIKLKVTSLGGPSANLHVGDEAWVYYHQDTERRFVELQDEEKQIVADPAEAESALTTQIFRTSITQTTEKNPETCESCDLSIVQPAATVVPETQTQGFEDIVEYVEEEGASELDLSFGYEEALTYINSVKPNQRETNKKIARTVLSACAKEKVPVAFALGIMRQESQFDPKARSYANARGLMQIMSPTWKGLGGGDTSRYDIDKNVRLGVKYLGQLLKSYHGDKRLTAAAYNWGMGNVSKYRRGEKKMSSTARHYVAKVMKYQQVYVDFEKSSKTMLAKN